MYPSPPDPPPWPPTPPMGPPETRGRAEATASQRTLTWVIAAAGGLTAALLADGSPTSWPLADAVQRGLLVTLCALAGSRARRWTLVWAAAVVVVAGNDVSRALGAIALAGALAMLLVVKRRGRVEGAALGAVLGWCVLDLGWPAPTGATALLAFVAVAPLLVSGVRHAGRSARRSAAWIGAGLALVAVVGVGGATLLAAAQRSPLLEAVDQTQAAVDSVGSSDSAETRDRFETAAGSFEAIASDASAWWLMPARALPLVGSNVELVRAAAEAGAGLSLAAADLTESVDQDSLRRPDGGIDLAVLASMGGPVASAGQEIASAQSALEEADSTWLVPPVRDRLDEFLDELESSAGTTELADLAIERLPDLLGGPGPRRYLLLLGNPAEARDLGGHIGNWAEIVADDGRLSMVEVGGPYDLFSPSTAPAPNMTPGAYPQSLVELRPQYFIQNLGGTADFPTVARLAAELYPQARPGAPLDGVVYADPAAFAAMLRVTGPVPIQGTQTTLTADNAVQFLTKDQFSVIPDTGEGSDALDEVIRTAVGQFTRGQLPVPRVLADAFSPVVDQGRLQFFSFHEGDDELVDRVGLRGQVERPGEGDLLAVLTRNASPNKLDAYLQREVDYSVSWNPETGREQARVRIRLTNAVPDGDLPAVVTQAPEGAPVGTNRMQLSVLSPLGAVAASIDGEQTGIGTQQEYAGVLRHSVLLDIPPGETREVVLRLDGTVGRGTYVLDLVGQPLLDPGRTRVTIGSSGGRLPTATGTIDRTFEGDQDASLTVRAGGR